jgi:cytochrome bd-type quinol oxidase subunit 1
VFHITRDLEPGDLAWNSTRFLSGLQWTWVIAWHILLPAFTVGLASYIAVLEGLYFIRGEEVW